MPGYTATFTDRVKRTYVIYAPTLAEAKSKIKTLISDGAKPDHEQKYLCKRPEIKLSKSVEISSEKKDIIRQYPFPQLSYIVKTHLGVKHPPGIFQEDLALMLITAMEQGEIDADGIDEAVIAFGRCHRAVLNKMSPEDRAILGFD
jgi:hypothetical protein